MSDDQVTEEEFLQHVKDHELTIRRDDGVYRHLLFRNPESGNRYFELHTFPGRLCYVGDMGSYVFCRLFDMFEFFRSGHEKMRINLAYWGEKLEAIDKHGGFEKFNADRFRAVINDYRTEWVKAGAREKLLTKAERRELWEAVEDEILCHDDNEEHEMMSSAYEFSRRYNHRLFNFEDIWERNFDSYTTSFIWCCYAIAWGIKQYDAAKVKP